jgi:SAM-dependent methyltransferase
MMTANGRATAPGACLADEAPTSARVCPSCGSSDAAVSLASLPPAEDADFSVIRAGWRGFFKEKVFFTYSRCAGCGLLYAKRYLTPASVAALYGDMPENMAGVPVRSLEKTQRGYFDFFRRFAPAGGGYLEIGPDTGLFTQFVARECRFDDHLLFEPNRAVLRELTQRMGGRPHRLHNSLLDFEAVPDGSVSAVTMVHVLDHLLDPLETLGELRRKLIKGGLIMAVVHDESSLLARVLGRRWPAYCLQHPQVYRPATIRALFERAGFRVAAIEASRNHFPLAYLAQHLAFALKLGAAPNMWPENWSLPLRLGNFMIAAFAS